MRQEHTWGDTSANVGHTSGDSQAATGAKETGNTKSSTERGSAADKALIDGGGTIVSRLRLRPIAARALALLMEREGQTHGKQRAAIERALIEAAGGAEILEQLAVAEQAAAQAAAEAVTKAQAEAEAESAAQAEAAALGQGNRPRLSIIETELVALLETKGPIHGTAEIGYALWPNREMQPQGAALAAGGILRRLLDRGYIACALVDHRGSYSVTKSGCDAREQDRNDAIDSRQLTFLEH